MEKSTLQIKPGDNCGILQHNFSNTSPLSSTTSIGTLSAHEELNEIEVSSNSDMVFIIETSNTSEVIASSKRDPIEYNLTNQSCIQHNNISSFHYIRNEKNNRLMGLANTLDGIANNSFCDNNNANIQKFVIMGTANNNNKSITDSSNCQHKKNACISFGALLNNTTTSDSTLDKKQQEQLFYNQATDGQLQLHHSTNQYQLHHQAQLQLDRESQENIYPKKDSCIVSLEHKYVSNSTALSAIPTQSPSVIMARSNENSRDTHMEILTPELCTIDDVNCSNSPYATLTPLQPLPPISTMSEKFAYSGQHIQTDSNAGFIKHDKCETDRCNSNHPASNFAYSLEQVFIPVSYHNQTPNTLGSITLNSLSSLTVNDNTNCALYDKLPSIGLCKTPPDNYPSSTCPLSNVVLACDPPQNSPVGVTCESASSHFICNQSVDISKLSPLMDIAKISSSSNIRAQIANAPIITSSKCEIHLKPVSCPSPITIADNDATTVHTTDYELPLTIQEKNVKYIASSVATNDYHSIQIRPHSTSTVDTFNHINLLYKNDVHVSNNAFNSHNVCHKNCELTHDNLDRVSLTSAARSQLITETTDVVNISNNSVDSFSSKSYDLPLRRIISQAELQFNVDSSTGVLRHTLANFEDDARDENIKYNMYTLHPNQPQLTHFVETTDKPNNQQKQSKENKKDNSMHDLQSTTTALNRNTNSSANVDNTNIEEINTKELAQRISSELKRYSIPQAIFAQRVLCRSQGTLSDLLRNPKPWSKLKSGRETFRRMYKWLQEPEYQRMSALRMAAAQIPQRNDIVLTSSSNTLQNVTINHNLNGTLNHNSNYIRNRLHKMLYMASYMCICFNIQGNTSNSARNVTDRSRNEHRVEHMIQPKKPRLVFTDLQRRTLQAIFKVYLLCQLFF